MSIVDGVLAAVVALVASALQGITGLGFALVTVPILGVLINARDASISISFAAPLLALLQARRHWPERPSVAGIGWLMLPALFGVCVGALVLKILPVAWLGLLLGVVSSLFVLESAVRSRANLGTVSPVSGILVGGLAGISNGTMGASGPLLGGYLIRAGWTGHQFVFVIALMFSVMSLVRIVILILTSQYTAELVMTAAAVCIPAVLGQRIGFRLQDRLSRRRLSGLMFGVVLVSSTTLVIRNTVSLVFG